jgi:hypothetical protein
VLTCRSRARGASTITSADVMGWLRANTSE